MGTHVRIVDRYRPAMSRDELWEAAEWQTKVLQEAHHRGITPDLFGKLDMARAITLAMYSTAPSEPGHSVRIPVEVVS